MTVVVEVKAVLDADSESVRETDVEGLSAAIDDESRLGDDVGLIVEDGDMIVDVDEGLMYTTEEDFTAEDERIVVGDMENIIDDVDTFTTGADDDVCVMEVVSLLALTLTVVVDMDGTVL